nr:hypothetical protein [Tanacetum cinerariifolium]
AAASQWVLRRQMAPARSGIGRSLAVGALTVVIAAVLAAGSTWALAYVLGDKALAYSRAELVEITKRRPALWITDRAGKYYYILLAECDAVGTVAGQVADAGGAYRGNFPSSKGLSASQWRVHELWTGTGCRHGTVG